jgi:hypothetical protein
MAQDRPAPRAPVRCNARDERLCQIADNAGHSGGVGLPIETGFSQGTSRQSRHSSPGASHGLFLDPARSPKKARNAKSMGLNLLIVFETIKTILRRRGAQ